MHLTVVTNVPIFVGTKIICCSNVLDKLVLCFLLEYHHSMSMIIIYFLNMCLSIIKNTKCAISLIIFLFWFNRMSDTGFTQEKPSRKEFKCNNLNRRHRRQLWYQWYVPITFTELTHEQLIFNSHSLDGCAPSWKI